MESPRKSNKKWVAFGIIIATLAVLVAVGPIFITKYMRHKYNDPKQHVRTEIMIKVKGVIKQSADEKTVFLAGENGLFYILFGPLTDDLLKNLGKTVTVFGKMYDPLQDEPTIDDQPVRLRIEVVNMGFPNL
ncbi:MAG: hypothetical protein FWG57_01085 [Endomicrobia bacterium]|jgi:hypothetical protein|nr:hypothetical protein [Endomicrobiia bacterium]